MDKVIVRIETDKNNMVFCFKAYKNKKVKMFLLTEKENHINEIIDYLSKDRIYLGIGIKERETNIINKIINNKDRYKSMSAKQIIDELIKISDEKNNIISIDAAIVNGWKDTPLSILKQEYKYKDKIDERDDFLIIKGISNNILFIENLIAENQNKIVAINNLGKRYKMPLQNLTEPEIISSIFKRFYTEKNKSRTISFPPYIENTKMEQTKRITTILKMNDTLNSTQNSTSEEITINDINITLTNGGISHYKSYNNFGDKDNTVFFIDIESFYPKIIINNKLYPINLNQEKFIEEYKYIYQLKIEEKDPDVKQLYKNLINKLFGMTKTKNPVVKDPVLFKSIITIGQVTMVHLIESISKKVGNLKVKMIHTDGLFITVPNKNKELFLKVIDKWKEIAGFNITIEEVSSIFISKTGSYIKIVNGEIYSTGDLKYDNSKFINHKIAKSMTVNFMIDDIDYVSKIDEIRNVKNFLIKQSIKKGNQIIITNEKGKRIEYKHNTIFFYVTNEGYKLSIKNKATGKETPLPYNAIKLKANINDIDKQYYIQKTNNLIQTLL